MSRTAARFNATLRADARIQASSLTKLGYSSWHSFEGVSKSALKSALRRFSIISFNYDRCIEQFIRVAIENLYSLKASEADEIASGLQVIHPIWVIGSPS
jgi:hypothetical protein